MYREADKHVCAAHSFFHPGVPSGENVSMALDALLDCLSPGQRNGLKRALAVIPSAWRQRPVYRRWRRFLEEAQHWPRERIEAWQLEKLRELIRLAVTQTEGYRELYARAGVTPEDIRSLDDVRKLPFTTKEMFRDQTAAFTIRQGGGRYVTTGGSTGIPFGFHELPETSEMEKAFMHTGWSWMGWQQDQVSAVLRGGFIGTEKDFATYDPFHRQLALSSYFLTAGNVAQYLDAIRQAGVRVLQPPLQPLLLDQIAEEIKRRRISLEHTHPGLADGVEILARRTCTTGSSKSSSKLFPRRNSSPGTAIAKRRCSRRGANTRVSFMPGLSTD